MDFDEAFILLDGKDDLPIFLRAGKIYFPFGDIDEEGKDSHIDNFGTKLDYTLEQDGFTMDIGMCYINNLIDSDCWGDSSR